MKSHGIFLSFNKCVWGICPLHDFVFICLVLSSQSFSECSNFTWADYEEKGKICPCLGQKRWGCGDGSHHETRGEWYRRWPSPTGRPGGRGFPSLVLMGNSGQELSRAADPSPPCSWSICLGPCISWLTWLCLADSRFYPVPDHQWPSPQPMAPEASP